MPDVQHSTLTGAELHEPKGISGAAAGQYYAADGAGSGAWQDPELDPSDGTADSVFIADGAGGGSWEEPQFGQMYTVDTDAATLSGIGTTPVIFPFSNDGEANGVTVDSTTNNDLEVTVAGVYQIHFSCSISTVASGDSGLYEWDIYVNGVKSTFGVKRNLSGTADNGSVSLTGLINLSANDTIDVRVDEASNTDDINIAFAQLSAFKVL